MILANRTNVERRSVFCTMYTSSTRKRVDHRAALRAGERSTRLCVELVCSRAVERGGSSVRCRSIEVSRASPSPGLRARLSRRESKVTAAFRESVVAI